MSTAESPKESPWRLRADLVSARVLLWVASAGRRGEPTPEVHLYLFHRYWYLADHYAHHGKIRKARRLRAKATAHFKRGGGGGPGGPPFAAALAMPRPMRPTFIDAVSKRRLPRGDDAA